MRRFAEDLARFLGIAQGVYFVAVNLGVGFAVLGAVTGMLAVAADLPWWSVGIIGLGSFTATTGLLGALAKWIAGKRASPLTPVIESGRHLRARLAAITVADPTTEERERWKRRVEDWIEEAERKVDEIAPHRLGAFKADALYVTVANKWAPVPLWVAEQLVELDVRLERLETLRVTL